MMTLEQFQQTILKPLREQREAEVKECAETLAAAQVARSSALTQIEADESTFFAEQRRQWREFEQRQGDAARAFRQKIRDRRSELTQSNLKSIYDSKARRRMAFEQYTDAVGRAFAQYNTERMQQGEAPVTYDDIKLLKQKEASNEQQ